MFKDVKNDFNQKNKMLEGSQMQQWIWKFLQEEDGPTAVEYAVMLALIVIVCIASIKSVGLSTTESLTDSQEKISDAIN